MLRALDQFVLSLCTKFAHAFQVLTGKTNFFIAKVGVLLAIITVVLNIINYFHPVLSLKSSVGSMVWDVFIFIQMARMVSLLDGSDKSAENGNERTADWAELRGRVGIRLIGLLLSCLGILLAAPTAKISKSGFLDTLCLIGNPGGFTMFVYFVSVEPLRPGKSKIKQGVENFFMGFQKLARATPRR